MTVRAIDGVIALEGACPVEDAESLLALLQQHPGAAVNLAACTQLHTAVMQILLAAGACIEAVDPSGFLGRWVAPLLLRPPAVQPPIENDPDNL